MTKVQSAMKPSAAIMVILRSQRSIYTPAKGPMSACGKSADMAAKAKTSAEPVSRLSQMMMAKLTAELLRRDINCPVQMIIKVCFHVFCMISMMCCGFLVKHESEKHPLGLGPKGNNCKSCVSMVTRANFGFYV